MFIITITIFILMTQQPEHNRLAKNQPTAGLSSLNEYENGMGKSETELQSSTFYAQPQNLIWGMKCQNRDIVET